MDPSCISPTAVTFAESARMGGAFWRIARAWPPEAEGKLRSETGWTSFAVAPGGLQLVYVACVAETPDTARPPDYPPHLELRGPVDTDNDFHYDLFRVTNDGTDAERLTVNGAIEFYPAWSPDGRRIAFLSDAGRYDPDQSYWHPGLGLYTMAPDGTDVRQVLGKEFEVLHQPPQWSPDSRQLAVVLYQTGAYHELRGRSLHLVDAAGGESQQLARSVVSGPSWSPNGQWLAYARATVEPGVALHTVWTDGTDDRRITDIPIWTVPQLPDVLHSEAWIDTVAWSPDGTRILVRSDPGVGICRHPCNGRDYRASARRRAGGRLVARRLADWPYRGPIRGGESADGGDDGGRRHGVGACSPSKKTEMPQARTSWRGVAAIYRGPRDRGGVPDRRGGAGPRLQ